MPTAKPVLVTGATGYVGGRLVPRLLDAGYRVRTLARSTVKLQGRPWAGHPRVELAAGDVLDYESLFEAAQGCRAAYYLVHSMTATGDFSAKDRQAATNMAQAAAAAGMERIIYLGGLGHAADPHLSEHLRSRQEVAAILQSGPVPATFLRAAMILGSGGAAFEIMRYLVDRLPVMLTPRWVNTPVQPIAIRNVLNYLVGCLEHPQVKGETFDIGGPEVVTYRQLFDIYAEEAHLPKRLIIPVPVLTPRLSSYWIHLITPVPASLAQPLAAGLSNPVICQDNRIRDLIPQDLLDCRQTIHLALERIKQQTVETCWRDAGPMIPPEWTHCGDTEFAGGTVLSCGYRVQLQAAPEEVWDPISKIGGETGYYFGDWLWEIRGWLDRLVGGAGLNRGRLHPTELKPGDALDFWRVLAVEPPQRLLLLAEMKMPGEALKEFRLTPLNGEQTEVQQLSRFLPRGLGGILYWYSLFPFHQLIYRGMLKALARAVGKPILSGPTRFTPALPRKSGGGKKRK
ncbi:MAG: SDR family oxidoreductase [Syntrophales bacterium]|nr:SDR family oxidoreductase [Syntrophales bacterium]